MSAIAKAFAQRHALAVIAGNQTIQDLGLHGHTIQKIEGRRLQIQGETWRDFLY